MTAASPAGRAKRTAPAAEGLRPLQLHGAGAAGAPALPEGPPGTWGSRRKERWHRDAGRNWEGKRDVGEKSVGSQPPSASLHAAVEPHTRQALN